MMLCWVSSCEWLISTSPYFQLTNYDSGGYIVSAIFICAEYQRLGIHFRDQRILRASFWIKLVFIIVELGLAIGFGVTEYYSEWNVSAVLEWTIALIYIFYVWVSNFRTHLINASSD